MPPAREEELVVREHAAPGGDVVAEAVSGERRGGEVGFSKGDDAGAIGAAGAGRDGGGGGVMDADVLGRGCGCGCGCFCGGGGGEGEAAGCAVDALQEGGGQGAEGGGGVVEFDVGDFVEGEGLDCCGEAGEAGWVGWGG